MANKNKIGKKKQSEKEIDKAKRFDEDNKSSTVCNSFL